MNRTNHAPNGFSPDYPGITPIKLGGTGGETPDQAVINLNLISKTSIGAANGPIPLDKNIKIPARFLGSTDTTRSVSLIGPTSVLATSESQYVISNYDINTVYEVSSSYGTVAVNGNVVTYTAPVTPGEAGFMINGRVFSVLVTPATGPVINGIKTVVLGTLNQFTIGNYTTGKTYTASVSAGNVSVVDNVITYYSPTSVGEVSLTVSDGQQITTVLIKVTEQILIQGPVNLYARKTGLFTINNYDSETIYHVQSQVEGIVERSGNQLTYRASNVVGSYGFKINGQIYEVNVLEYPVPVLTGPTAVFGHTVTEFTITNYDADNEYNVSVTLGTKTVSGNKIFYGANVNSGNGTIVVNGVTTNVKIVPPPVVTGPSSLYITKTGTYTITNYDSAMDYPVTTGSGGTVSRSGSTITYTAPNTLWTTAGGFEVAGYSVPVTLQAYPLPTVTGISSMYPNKTALYTITNYDAGNTYTLGAISGSVSRSGSTITYTAPNATGSGGFVINGVTVGVSVVAYPAPTVSGTTSMYTGTSSTFTITNYDSSNAYTITPVGGSVVQNGATITYTAPGLTGSYGFRVTGIGGGTVLVSVTISALTVNTPSVAVTSYTVTEYENGSSGFFTYTHSYTFVASAYGLSNGSVAGYTHTEWQISPNQSAIWDAGTTSGTTYSNNYSSDSAGTSHFYARARHYSSIYGYSAWSAWKKG